MDRLNEVYTHNFADLASRMTAVETLKGSAVPPMDTKGKSVQRTWAKLSSTFDFISTETQQDVMSGTFDIDELWRLDIDKFEADPNPPAAAANDGQLARRYPNVVAITRPWIVYAMIRDTAESGMACHLLAHLRHIFDLSRDYPHSWSGVLRYHFGVCFKRLSTPGSREEWQLLDQAMLTTELWSRLHPSDVATRVSRPVGDNGRWIWVEDLAGSETSNEWCPEYQAMEPCISFPCLRRHGCVVCGPTSLHHCFASCPVNPVKLATQAHMDASGSVGPSAMTNLGDVHPPQPHCSSSAETRFDDWLTEPNPGCGPLLDSSPQGGST